MMSVAHLTIGFYKKKMGKGNIGCAIKPYYTAEPLTLQQNF